MRDFTKKGLQYNFSVLMHTVRYGDLGEHNENKKINIRFQPDNIIV